MSITLEPITPNVGVSITGVGRDEMLRPETAEAVSAALARHLVVLFPALHIADDDLVTFSKMLGEVVVANTSEHRHPEIQTITMDPEIGNEVVIPYRKGNFLWHVDGTHDVAPQKATLLSAQRVDEFGGGDTEFASTIAAYDALPESEREALEGLTVVHRFAAALERTFPDATESERATWNRQPPREHPLVWNHWSGRRSLVIGSTADHIVGMDREEGRAMLDRLLDWSTRPQFRLRHQWKPGDLVMFDNTGCLHRALPFENTSHRLLHRTTLVGAPSAA